MKGGTVIGLVLFIACLSIGGLLFGYTPNDVFGVKTVDLTIGHILILMMFARLLFSPGGH